MPTEQMGRSLVKVSGYQGRVEAVMTERLPTGCRDAFSDSFSNCLSTSVSSCTLLMEKAVRITKPGGGGPLTWIRSGPNWHLVSLTPHIIVRGSAQMHARQWRCRRLSYNSVRYLWEWEDVSGCLWNLIVCECERDRKQREDDRKTKRGR